MLRAGQSFKPLYRVIVLVLTARHRLKRYSERFLGLEIKCCAVVCGDVKVLFTQSSAGG